MSFLGLSGAALSGIALGGATVVSGLLQSKAASLAADTQTEAAESGIEEQRRQFDKIQEILKPYVDAGAGSLKAQQGLLGLLGPNEEKAALDKIINGETFKSLAQQGENSILQNASATGGLRGGNVQAALAQFRPNFLSSLIEQQYNRLGGITNLGQASATGLASPAMTTGANIATLLGNVGSAQAGNQLASGKFLADIPSAIAKGIGVFKGLGGIF